MNNIWFTSDQHFGHSNILKYANRPFSSVHEMDEALIENHNKLVKKGDIVYHLGDVSFCDPTPFVTRLNGQHYLVRGNHDYKKIPNGLFIWIRDYTRIKIGDLGITLCHFAGRTWNKAHHGDWMLYGHDHGSLPDYGKSTDVGVDNPDWKYRPVHFEELKIRFANRECIKHH